MRSYGNQLLSPAQEPAVSPAQAANSGTANDIQMFGFGDGRNRERARRRRCLSPPLRWDFFRQKNPNKLTKQPTEEPLSATADFAPRTEHVNLQH